MVVTPASPDGFYPAGSNLHLTATPNPGYAFTRFHKQPLGQNPLDVTIADVPINLIAEFGQAGTYTISTRTISVPPVISPSPGTQYVFTQWSDGVTTASRTILAGLGATFVAQPL